MLVALVTVLAACTDDDEAAVLRGWVEDGGGFIGLRLAPDVARDRPRVHVRHHERRARPRCRRRRRQRRQRPRPLHARRRLTLDLDSRKVLLEVPNDDSGHRAGDIVFAADGTLLLGTGDNTDNVEDDFAPLDPDPANPTENALRTSSNPDDLWGKVLRLEPDGSIPEGNLFPDGEGGRPEIYVMGVRNPCRIGADPERLAFWWGDIGPDAPIDGPRPPRLRRIERGRRAGRLRLAPLHRRPTPLPGAARCRHGRGRRRVRLLGHHRPVLAYDYLSVEDPTLGGGIEQVRFDDGSRQILGRALMVGPWYQPEGPAPARLPIGDGLLLHEFARHRLLIGTPQADGSLADLRRVAPWLPVNTPIEVEVAPDGSLWVLEYGQWSEITSGTPRLTRIAWNPDGPVPDLPETRRGTTSDARERDGAELYQLNCSSCHGADGGGGRGPSLLGIAQRLTRDQHLEVVREGRGEMPAWDGALTPEEIETVVAYERTLEE